MFLGAIRGVRKDVKRGVKETISNGGSANIILTVLGAAAAGIGLLGIGRNAGFNEAQRIHDEEEREREERSKKAEEEKK